MLRAGCTWTTSGAAIARGRTGEAIRAGGSRLEPLCHVCLPKDWHAAPSALSPWTQQLSNSRGSLPCPSPSPGPPIPLTLWQAPAPPARWGYPRNLGHICKEEQSSALSGPRPQGTWCLTVDLGSQKPVGVCPVGGGEARNSGRTLETEEAPTQGLTELRKGSTGQCQQIGQRG